jgi:hypothetical protein
MPEKICITSTRSVGCTFIDWSLHFLSGQTHYFNVKQNKLIPLSHDPINSINAHGHLKNHPEGFKNFLKELNQLDLLDHVKMCSIYPFPMYFDTASKILGYQIEQLSDNKILQEVLEYILQDYNKFFRICAERNTKMIFVATDYRTVLYYQNIRSLDRHLTSPTRPTCNQDLINEFQTVFFTKSVNTWNQLQLTNIWDIREQMALDLRPFDRLTPELFDFQYPHLWINSLELWSQPIDTVKRILDYAQIKIDSNRLADWIPICQSWQKIQTKLLEFDYIQKHIVDAIVHNWDFSIDLTFYQEVIIQHCLIYQYNLNLKTWQLEKFPNNTKLLHNLLEPNIHPTKDIYGLRSTASQ